MEPRFQRLLYFQGQGQGKMLPFPGCDHAADEGEHQHQVVGIVRGTGNAGMTVGGTGDVLAGLTGALFAKHEAFPSACSAAFINGAAGDIAFLEFGYGLLATDVIVHIPGAMKL